MRKWINIFEDEQSYEDKVEEFFSQYIITHGNYIIRGDGSVDFDSDVRIDRKCKELTIPFGTVDGEFSLYNTSMKTLKNCPRVVNGDFNCSSSYITSLEHFPKVVNGDVYCDDMEVKDNYEFRHILFAQIEGDIQTGIRSVDEILNKYKNNKSKLPIAFSELKSAFDLYKQFGLNDKVKQRVLRHFDDYGIPYIGWHGDYLVAQRYKNSYDFAEDHGDRDMEHYASIIDGKNDFEFDAGHIDSYYYDDILRKLPPDLIQKLKEHLDTNHITDSDIEENSDIDDIFQQACDSGLRSGAEGEMYKLFTEAFTEHKNIFFVQGENLSGKFVFDVPIVLVVDINKIFEILADNDAIEAITNYSWWYYLNDGDEFTMNVPRDGFSGFDDAGAAEYCGDLLREYFSNI